uniref:ABC-2 type transporter n=1 Tax=Kumanoa americana TaxID=1196377 RepID=A0A1C9CGW8_9FLOR|nr:ABC-2 type transporter [Kumanoa americana]AOM67602.1 ABC-2 type transporter [Kumanoa americana]
MKNFIFSSTILVPKFKITKPQSQIRDYLQEICSLLIRLLIQSIRRPSFVITGILQPLLWLIIFGALFQNAPISMFTPLNEYKYFISAGIIVFTVFTSALNAGLPIIFDREFGFLNRLLITPLSSRYSILISSSCNIILISSIQVALIMCSCYQIGYCLVNVKNLYLVIITLLLLSFSITNLSIMLAFQVPGHVELLACILIINLPLLFSSTALAPLIFMPSWLQIIASINPLSYAIETIRYAYLYKEWKINTTIMETVWGPIKLIDIVFILIFIYLISFIYIKKLISNKFEE